jgi:hypothetical protein
VAETPDAENRHDITGARAAIAEGVEGRKPRAHQRSRFYGRELFWNQRQRAGRSDHIIGIAAVESNACNLTRNLAGEKIPSATGDAIAAIPAIPSYTDTLAGSPSGDARPNSINEADDLMPRNSRVLDTWEGSLLCKRVAVADSAGLYFDSHPTRVRLRDFAFDKLEWSVRMRDLHDTHLRHNSSDIFLHQASHCCGVAQSNGSIATRITRA